MNNTARSNSGLPELATRAQSLHGEIVATRKRGLSLAMDAGDVLIKAKELVPHGGWSDWLTSVGINARTARLYMQVARGRDDLKTATVAGLREAAEWLAEQHKKPSPYAHLTREALEDDLLGADKRHKELREELAAKLKVKEVLEARIKELSKIGQGPVIAKLHKSVGDLRGRLADAMRETKRAEQERKRAEQERNEARRNLENQIIPL